MATIRFSNSANTMGCFFDGSVFSLGFLSTNANSTQFSSTSSVFGGNISQGNSTGTTAFMYVYKGTVPTSFESFNGNLASRNSDLLLVLPKLGNNISQTSTTGTRYIISRSNLEPNYTYSAPIGSTVSANVTRVNNACTLSFAWNASGDAQRQFVGSLFAKINLTISGAADSTFNGSFPITYAGSNSTHYIVTWDNTGANANLTSATASYSPIGLDNGTATWFCMKSVPFGAGGSYTPAAADANLLSPRLSFSTSYNTPTAVIGNIGVTGSGSDLEMNSTSIVANARYNSLGFYMNFPYTWNIT